MYHCKVHIKHADLHLEINGRQRSQLENGTHKLRVGMNYVGDTLTCESFLTETPFDVVQNFGMSRVRLVEDVLEGEIRGAEAVTEVLRKDPASV
jgi:hypothetical protein